MEGWIVATTTTRVAGMSNSSAQRVAAKHPTILIADDHVLVRNGMKMLLAGMFGSARFLEVADADSLLVAARRTPVHLALVDLRMPGMQGGMRLPELARRHPTIPFVVVSALSSPDVVRRIQRIPTVYAFVPKAADHRTLCGAIEAAMQGRKLQYVHGHRSSTQRETMLTPRQEQIRDLLRQGLPNKMIARTLGISEGTVKNHITEIFRALKATNRTQAAQLGAEEE